MYQLVLTKGSYSSFEPGGPDVGRRLAEPRDGANARELERQLEELATQAGGKLERDSKSERGSDGPGSPGRVDYFPQDWEKVIEVATYSFVSLAAFVSFTNNAISIIKNLRDLSANPSRSVHLRVGDKQVEVKDGDDLEELARRHLASDRAPPPTTARKAQRKKKL